MEDGGFLGKDFSLCSIYYVGWLFYPKEREGGSGRSLFGLGRRRPPLLLVELRIEMGACRERTVRGGSRSVCRTASSRSLLTRQVRRIKRTGDALRTRGTKKKTRAIVGFQRRRKRRERETSGKAETTVNNRRSEELRGELGNHRAKEKTDRTWRGEKGEKKITPAGLKEDEVGSSTHFGLSCCLGTDNEQKFLEGDRVWRG